MAMTDTFEKTEPTRAEINALEQATVIEFGTPWCGYCRAAQGPLATALADHPHVHHLKIQDGRGRPLGRSFGVKLWPTLIFIKNGQEVARLVRPRGAQEIEQALARIDTAT
ncbi:MAG: thioredoxin family protein [Candidatus Competibacteraceae bacterium]|nr:thioredoxin family protein [Candidatus Competibacteraceae bacterium]